MSEAGGRRVVVLQNNLVYAHLSKDVLAPAGGGQAGRQFEDELGKQGVLVKLLVDLFGSSW